MKMEITKKQAVSIFEELGFATANKWDVPQLQNKISKMPEICEDVNVDSLDAKVAPLIKTILKKFEDGKKVKVVATDDGQQKEKEKKVVDTLKEEVTPRPADKKEKKEKVVKEKKVKVKGEKKERKPGIIATIITCLQKKYTTHQEIHDVLVEKFPDKNKNGMMTTVKCAVPSYLQTKRGLKIIKQEVKDGETKYKIG
jgi:hypothetical protein